MRITYFFIILSWTFSSNVSLIAQDVFPGKDVSLISGKKLQVQPKTSFRTYGFPGFYTDSNFSQILMPPLFVDAAPINTAYDSIVNKVFHVELVSTVSYAGKSLFRLKIVSLDSPAITCYFKYDPRYRHLWPFSIQKASTLPANFYCDQITKSEDPFTREKTYLTPFVEGIAFKKVVISKDSIKYYLLTSQSIANEQASKKGIYLILADNISINNPETTIQSSKTLSLNIYTAALEIKQEQLESFSKHPIIQLKVLDYIRQINDGTVLKTYLYCLQMDKYN